MYTSISVCGTDTLRFARLAVLSRHFVRLCPLATFDVEERSRLHASTRYAQRMCTRRDCTGIINQRARHASVKHELESSKPAQVKWSYAHYHSPPQKVIRLNMSPHESSNPGRCQGSLA